MPIAPSYTIGSMFFGGIQANIESLKNPVSELIGTTRPVGIELELENVKEQTIKKLIGPTKTWNAVTDASLYNKGIELVTQNKKATCQTGDTIPINGILYDKAMEELAGVFSKYRKISRKFDETSKGLPRCSERCSNHVHVSVLDKTVTDIKKIYVNYLMFEPLLFHYIGGHRGTNIFCYPYALTVNSILRLKHWPKEHDPNLVTANAYRNSISSYFNHNFKKYEALNMHSITKYGTVEFRQNTAQYQPAAITNWIKILIDLVEYDGPTLQEMYGVDVTFVRLVRYMKQVFKNTHQSLYYAGCGRDIFTGYSRLLPYLPEAKREEEKLVFTKFFNRLTKDIPKVKEEKVVISKKPSGLSQPHIVSAPEFNPHWGEDEVCDADDEEALDEVHTISAGDWLQNIVYAGPVGDTGMPGPVGVQGPQDI